MKTNRESGKIKGYKIGNSWFYTEELRTFIKSNPSISDEEQQQIDDRDLCNNMQDSSNKYQERKTKRKQELKEIFDPILEDSEKVDKEKEYECSV